MSESNEAIPLEGHCDPRFAAVREVFAKQLEQQEIGAAISFTPRWVNAGTATTAVMR